MDKNVEKEITSSGELELTSLSILDYFEKEV